MTVTRTAFLSVLLPNRLLHFRDQQRALQGALGKLLERKRDDDPFCLARDIANTVAEEYSEYNFETRNSQRLNSRRFIKSQRDTVEVRLKKAQERLREFQEEAQIVSVAAYTSDILGQLHDSRDELERLTSVQKSIDSVLRENRNMGRVSEGTLSSIPPEEGGSTFIGLGNQLQALNQGRNQLLVNFTEAHPQVRDLDARKQVIVKNMLSSLRVQRDIVSRRMKSEKQVFETLENEYGRLPELSIRLGELVRRVEVQKRLLLAIEEEYQASRIAQSEEVHQVTVLQKALLPTRPTNPSTPTTTGGVGALLGLILGVVFAFIAETLDTSIGTIEDVEEYIEVPVVGIIPHVDLDDMKDALIQSGVAEDDTETMERRLRLAAHFEPRSVLAESYRALRTNIQFANLEKGAKVISLTSASHQEGKSTTSANLAMTLAQAGNRVLLVDADLRRPTINRIFGLDREPGVTDVILGNYNWRDVVRTVTDIMVGGLGMEDIMMTPGMDNLNIITSGVIPPNPAEITSARRMNEFIEEVRSVYDVVLFDSPPILQATDSTILGTKMDGVLVVYKIGQVSRSALKRAKLQLDNVDIPVLGVVINGLKAEASEDFRDLRYYSYYSYGSEPDLETGPPIQRFYNRVIRRLKSVWNDFYKIIQPLLEWAQERYSKATEEDTSPEEEAEAVEEDDSGSSVILNTLFWVFLILLLAAGILWQLGYVAASGRPQQRDKVLEFKNVKPPTLEVQEVRQPASALVEPEVHPKSPARTASTPMPVVTLQPKPEPQIKPSINSDSGLFTIHVSSHKVRVSAENEAGKYRRRGFPVRLMRKDIQNRGQFYRVLVGAFSTRLEASHAAKRLRAKSVASYTSILPMNTPVHSDI